MKIIESVKVILPDPGHAVATQVIAKIKDSDSSLDLVGIQRYDEVDLTAMALVHWPIDIHIDSKGAIVTLRMRASELELNGVAVKVEEPASDEREEPKSQSNWRHIHDRYEGETTGLSMTGAGGKYGFIHTGWGDEPADESQHNIAQLVKGSEYFVPLPNAAEFTSLDRNSTRCEVTIKKNFPIGTVLRNHCVLNAGHEGLHEVSGLKWNAD